MHIEMIQGEDPRLYQRVAPLVMNPRVLAYNNNYPFKTSADHIWFIASHDDGTVAGFMPVQCKERKATINNYYVADDTPEVFAALLEHIAAGLPPETVLMAVVHTRHEELFAARGFALALRWTKYVKMIFQGYVPKKRL